MDLYSGENPASKIKLQKLNHEVIQWEQNRLTDCAVQKLVCPFKYNQNKPSPIRRQLVSRPEGSSPLLSYVVCATFLALAPVCGCGQRTCRHLSYNAGKKRFGWGRRNAAHSWIVKELTNKIQFVY